MDSHLLNITLHVAAGLAAMAIGFLMLVRDKGTPAHRRLGRWFVYATGLVCLFAATGLLLFRFLPMFAVLTVLVTYQLVGGWHVVYTQERGPSLFDAAWTLLAIAFSVVLVQVLLAQELDSPSVVYSTLGALGSVIAYDTVRWFFPRRWFASLWKYEHTYKMLAALFGMLSALVGNVVEVGQPWSQLVPSVVGLFLIGYFFVRMPTTGGKR